jgi:hypothetical protein
LVKNDTVKITYYLPTREYVHIMRMARFLYDQKAIPRPTAGTYSRAVVLKMSQELYNLLSKEKEEDPISH